MKSVVKEKLTVSLDPRLVDVIDQEIQAHHANSRSAVVEEALRLWRTKQHRQAIEQGVESYYQSRSRKEKQEDQTWARFASRQAKDLWND